MNSTKKYISELMENPGPYSVKLKVVEKWRPVISPNKTKYQRYVMQDEKGDKIQATVFGSNVDDFDKIVHQNKEYEIENARVKLMKEEFQTRPNELEMHFNSYTIVHPLSSPEERGESPEYGDLSSIVSVPQAAELYDDLYIVVVVLYVGPTKTVRKKETAREVDVREVLVIDKSVEHPVMISAWGDLASAECSKISSDVDSFPVIGFTFLRGSNYEGFSLSTSMSTRIIFDPHGDKAVSLVNWVKESSDSLKSLRNKIFEVRIPTTPPKMTFIEDSKQKNDEETNSCMEPSTNLMHCVKTTDAKLTSLVSGIFPEINNGTVNPDIFSLRAILAPQHEQVEAINKDIINRFPGEPVTYWSWDSVLNDEDAIYPLEFLHSLSPTGVSPHELILKENCPVILLRDIDPSSGLRNGTGLICKKLSRNVIMCEVASGCQKGTPVLLPRIPMRSSEFGLEFQRKQFPVKLSFAMTIKEAQGRMLEKVAVYLKKPCSSHRQLHVALSKSWRADQLMIFYDAEFMQPEEFASAHKRRLF